MFEQFLSHFHRHLRVEAADHFLALLGVHRGKRTNKIVARFGLGVATPADSNGKNRGGDPDRDIP